MRRFSLSACALVAALVPAAIIPAQAALADGDCPPGSWFCEATPVAPQVQPAAPQQNVAPPQNVAPNATVDGSSGESLRPHHRRRVGETVEVQGSQGVQIQAQGPIVIYTQGGMRTVPYAPSYAPAPMLAPPPPPMRRLILRQIPQPAWREHFGINVRVEGAGFKSSTGGSSGMGGVGASLRWRPMPALAFDFGGDVMGGNDYYNNGRVETALSLSGMLYFNPKSPLQVYAIAGMHLSHADISPGTSVSEPWDAVSLPTDTTRNYFGGQGGLGLEWRIARHLGIDIDGLAIIRHALGSDAPEFTNPATGQTSNTSVAGMGRAGMTFWW